MLCSCSSSSYGIVFNIGLISAADDELKSIGKKVISYQLCKVEFVLKIYNFLPVTQPLQLYFSAKIFSRFTHLYGL